MSKRALVGGAAAFLLGLSDYVLFTLFDVTMTIGERDVTWWVVFFFACNFGVLGMLIGWLWDQKDELRDRSKTIEDQLVALEKAQQKLVEVEKLAALGRMSSGVAHEVRNPLGVIRSSASLIQSELDNDELEKAAQFICDEVDRLNSFVTRLLDFSRPFDLNAMEVEPEEVLLRVAQVASCEPGESPKQPVKLDLDLVTRALATMVANARNAVGESGRVEVLAIQGDGVMQFRVRDDGPGVSDDIKETMFEPFATDRAEGTGLGLPMAAKIAELHGGTLRYLTKQGLGPDGKGACFELEVPA